MTRIRLQALLWPLAGLLLLAGPARAQLAPDSARLVVKLAVAPLFRHVYEVEGEYRLLKQLSLTLAPRLVAGPVPASVSPTANAAGDQVRGYGLSLGPRFYLPNTGADGALLAGMYVSLRADYQRLGLSYQREAWGEELGPDGLRYYTYRPRDFRETISRFGGSASLGYQSQMLSPRLRLDVAASLHRASTSSSAGEASRYLTSATDYAHSGSFWSLGFSLGYVVK